MEKGTIQFVGKVMLAIALYELAWFIYTTKIAKNGSCACASKGKSISGGGADYLTLEDLG